MWGYRIIKCSILNICTQVGLVLNECGCQKNCFRFVNFLLKPAKNEIQMTQNQKTRITLVHPLMTKAQFYHFTKTLVYRK